MFLRWVLVYSIVLWCILCVSSNAINDESESADVNSLLILSDLRKRSASESASIQREKCNGKEHFKPICNIAGTPGYPVSGS